MTGVDGKYGIRTRWGAMVDATKDRLPGNGDGSGVGGLAASPQPWVRDRWVLAEDGPQTKTLSHLPVDNAPTVFLNRLPLDEGVDYTLTGQTLELLTAEPLTGDVLWTRYPYESDTPVLLGDITGDYPEQVLFDEAAIYWRLGGDPYLDSSGHGRTGYSPGGVGTINPVPGLLPGDADGAVDFAEQTIVQRDYESWMDVTALTVEAIVQTAASGDYFDIAERDDFGRLEQEWLLTMRPDGKLLARLYGTVPIEIVTAVAVNDDEPHHVAMTYGGGVFRCYVDGVVEATTPSATVLGTADPALRVGGNVTFAAPAVSALWPGVIDEFAFYTYGLSADRIAAHAAAAGVA